MTDTTAKSDTPESKGFTCPETYGVLKTATRQTPAAIVLVIVSLLTVALVALLLMIMELIDPNTGIQAGDAKEVTVEQVTLGEADPQELAQPQQDQTSRESQKPMESAQGAVETGTGQSDAPQGRPELQQQDTSQLESQSQQGTSAIEDAIRIAEAQIEQLRMSGAGMGGVFKLPADVDSVVYVLDRSGSMGGGLNQQSSPLDSVKAELIGALDFMKGKDKKFFIFFYDDVMHPLGSTIGSAGSGSTQNYQLKKSTDENIREAKDWIAGVWSGGGTNPVPAMLAAIKMEPDLIVLLSDGGFDLQMSDTIINNNSQTRGGEKINCVGISETIFETLLRITKATGGQYYQAR